MAPIAARYDSKSHGPEPGWKTLLPRMLGFVDVPIGGNDLVFHAFLPEPGIADGVEVRIKVADTKSRIHAGHALTRVSGSVKLTRGM